MKAGGASVLLDSTQPEERLRTIMRQTAAKQMLASTANEQLAKRLGRSTEVVVADSHLTRLSSSADTRLPRVDPSDTLYVVFTSGSTGTPKGAVITHANLSSALKHQHEALGFTRTSRVYDFASYAFDVAWLNILHTLHAGGCLCVPSESDRRDDIGRSMRQLEINYAALTPTVARVVGSKVLASLHTLILGGERSTKLDIENLGSVGRICICYGPAECTVTATFESVKDRQDRQGEDPSIGKGVGAATWVVDAADHNRLVPVGSIGELVIEGPLVGRGYLNDAKRAAAAFIEDPPWLVRGGPGVAGRRGRLYKTGDLVRYNADGTLQFVGRKDDQVKVRGQRVELGEVEHHVQKHLAAERSARVVTEVITPRGSDNAMLAAFIEVGGGVADIVAAMWEALVGVEEKLAAALPAFMIPSAYIPVARIPMTATGKTDRRRLRHLGWSLTRQQLVSYSRELSATKRQPSTDVERAMQAFYAQILNIESSSIGVDDDFFKLGGDSISAMQLSAKCRSAGLQLPVSHIFQRRTIAQSARGITKDAGNALSDVKEQFQVPFALSPVQQFFFETQPCGHNHFYQSFLLRVTISVSSLAMVWALEAVVSRHSMLRSRFGRDSRAWFQLITPQVDNSLRFRFHELHSLSDASNAINDSKLSLDIQHGPLFAADLINTRADGLYLFLVAHHLVIDLVSWRILLEDLEELLKNGVITNHFSWSFQAWCRAQAQYSLEHLFPELVLPFAVPSQPLDYWGSLACQRNTYGDTRQSRFKVDKHTTAALLGSANDAFGTEPVEIFQAVILHSFANTLLDRPTPVIFSEGHGRETWDDGIDVSRTVGWFTTMWPLHVPVRAQQGLAEVVCRIRDVRRKIPRKGWAYFASRYLNPMGRSAFKAYDQVELLFNFVGSFQQLERSDALLRYHSSSLNDEPSSGMRLLKRSALIEVSLFVSRGSLDVVFSINKHMTHQRLLDDWVARCKQSFETAAEQLVHMGTTCTLRDCPLLNLGPDTLDRLLTKADVSLPEIEEAFGCTKTQLLMLRAQFVEPELYATAFTGVVRVDQDVRTVGLEKLVSAWQALVDRHQSLRTVFVSVDDGAEWVQVILKRMTAAVLQVRCQHDVALETLSAQKPIDYRSGKPLHRIIFCQTPAGRIFFKLEISHAIMDAASRSVLFQEWSSMCMNRPLDDTAPLYGTYISHIHSISDAASRYWVEYLSRIRPCLFPAMSNPGADRGKLVSVRAESDASGELREFARRYGFTLPTLVKASWALVLHGFLGQSSVCFGYFDSARHVPIAGIDEMVGALANILICSVSFDRDAPLLAVLEAVQNDYYQALPHHAHALHAADVGLFNTLVNYRKETLNATSRSPEIHFDFIDGEDPMEFDLVLSIDDVNDNLNMSIGFWEGRTPLSVATEASLALRAALRRLLSDAKQCVSHQVLSLETGPVSTS